MRFLLLVFIGLLPSYSAVAQQTPVTVDICVYGGTSAGVIAAYTAKKAGKSVILIEPGRHLGGLTTGGLGFTDIGNKYAISGLALDFYRRLGTHYGTFEQWIFEPGVAENLFGEYVKRGGITVLYDHRLVSVRKEQTAIKEITLEVSTRQPPATNRVVRAKQFIDCSYEGDLLAKAKVSYTVGREANKVYNETINGVQLMDKHQFPDGIDPYKEPGKPESGLLWGISPALVAPDGTGDRKVQAYNFRICLSRDPANRIPITKPDNYDSTRYELLLRYLAKKPAQNLRPFLKMDLMPNQKTDINNYGPFSTDMIGMNYDFPEASYQQRIVSQKAHEEYTKGLLYFIGNDSRMPEHLRGEMKQWGYPKDEYTDTGHWSPQLYVREARRLIGEYVMTQANCEGKVAVTDGVGMAAYTMDSHNCQRVVVEKNGMKMVKNEGNVEIGGFPPYPISYRSLTPKATECTNLLVPVCLSASHIAYGSIRMEPVFMVLAQSSALAASMAIDAGTTVQRINVKSLQTRLRTDPLMDGSTPEILVDNDHETGVVMTGNWSRVRNPRGSYGPSWLVDSSRSTTPKTVRFVPTVTRAGTYAVYAYFPKLTGATQQTTLILSDGRQSRQVTIRDVDIRVKGQTSGEWVSLGQLNLPTGRQGYAEVSNQGANGIVVADALLFVPNR